MGLPRHPNPNGRVTPPLDNPYLPEVFRRHFEQTAKANAAPGGRERLSALNYLVRAGDAEDVVSAVMWLDAAVEDIAACRAKIIEDAGE